MPIPVTTTDAFDVSVVTFTLSLYETVKSLSSSRVTPPRMTVTEGVRGEPVYLTDAAFISASVSFLALILNLAVFVPL